MSLSKRWRDRAGQWSTRSDVFDPRQFAADVIERDAPAKAYIEQHHYSGSYPAARLRVGMYGSGARLVGVVVFSVPMNGKVLPHYFGALPGVELGRLVLDPSVGFNGESWIIARALRFARESLGVRAVLSYADPIARVDTQGALRKPAHWGTIYQASNALFAGRAEPRTLLVAPDGTVISQRSLTKIRKQERGHLYAERQLLTAGADTRRAGEDPSCWLERVSVHFRRVRHPGNLAYLFGLDDAARRALLQRHGARPYLKKGRCLTARRWRV